MFIKDLKDGESYVLENMGIKVTRNKKSDRGVTFKVVEKDKLYKSICSFLDSNGKHRSEIISFIFSDIEDIFDYIFDGKSRSFSFIHTYLNNLICEKKITQEKGHRGRYKLNNNNILFNENSIINEINNRSKQEKEQEQNLTSLQLLQPLNNERILDSLLQKAQEYIRNLWFKFLNPLYSENIELQNKIKDYENIIKLKDEEIYKLKEEKNKLEDSLYKSKENLISELATHLQTISPLRKVV
jgi:hypothetical protein